MPDQPPVLDTCKDAQGYTAYFDSCFRLSSNAATFSVAQSTCKAEGGYLSSVVDGYEEAIIETMMYMNNVDSAWLGMTDVSTKHLGLKEKCLLV